MSDEALLEVLEEAREYGFLGPGPLETHLVSARRFLAAIEPLCPGRVLDLGSGGGVPALPLVLWMPTTRFVLIEVTERRVAFLREVAERLGLEDRLDIVHERAELAGRRPELRGSCDAVTARSFAPPGVTAECGAPFLALGGVLVVSEPPEPVDRWNPDGLAELGLGQADVNDSPGVALMRQERPCPDRYPRRVGIPAKRPLF